MIPPAAKKVKHEMVMFGDIRNDDYYWLRDDSRSDPQVLSYLKEENAYTDILVVMKSNYFNLNHMKLVLGTKAFEDQLFAEMKGRIKEDDISVSIRKGSYYYYERTLKGKEYVQHCRRRQADNKVPSSMHDTMPTGPDAPEEHVILDENVNAQEYQYYSSPNNKLVAYAEDTKGDEIYTVYVIDADTRTPVGKPLQNVTSNLGWAGDDSLVYVTMDEFLRPDKDIQLFKDDLVVYEREDGLPKITIYGVPPIGKAIESLQGGRVVDFIDPIYSVDPEESEFSSNILQYSYSSPRSPPAVYDYDMDTGVSVLKKIEAVLGGFDASNYVTERKWAVASDGTRVPISVVYRKNLVKFDGSGPMLLYGYGSYEASVDPGFRASMLSLIDRGFIFAIAHVRGGGEMGRKWYENGKLLKKRNTFTDFISCAEYLLENKYCSKEKLCTNGRSAGGLLMGAVLNMQPDLFKAVVSGVPFVDVVTTMLDPTIPLTTSEWEEWGDPRKEEFYFYMKSYSPVDNIKPQNYPNILVTAGLNDPRVLYSEPAKFVAKLREMKTDENILLFKCEFGAGHSSKSGRFEKLQEDAFTYAFLLKVLNMVSCTGSG
ncbi:hypothetical protein MRB53_033806 [Persea americana]|uniref:Uncharacterized protein n=1 Tax=Persea americana TaxID=3435 RepID=A0ACC2KVV9_PERAE|nr:hypothetical protein MRB53_033806 [Persea americana]